MSINGTNQPDILTYNGTTDETIYGLNGDDSIYTINSNANNTIHGGNGDDHSFTGNGNNFVYGDNGNDTIVTGSGNEFINGGQGDDLITTGAGTDTVVLIHNGGIDTVTDFRALYAGPDQTITFDDLGGGIAPIPDGYEGFNWGSVYYLDTATYGTPSGYNNVGLGTNVAFDAFGLGGTITDATPGQDFALRSADMAAAWEDNLQVVVNGYNHGNLVATETLTLGVNPTHVTFNSRSFWA